jgi:hypothetical protein
MGNIRPARPGHDVQGRAAEAAAHVVVLHREETEEGEGVDRWAWATMPGFESIQTGQSNSNTFEFKF